MSRTFVTESTFPGICTLIEEAMVYLRAEGLGGRSLFVSELVLEEMLTNIVKYSFDDDQPHRIQVGVDVEGQRVGLELRDDGHLFDPTGATDLPAGTPLTEMKAGGRGISLVRKFTEEIKYRREDGWNILRLRFSANRDPGN